MLIRRFFAFVISAFLIFFPAYSYATTSAGGWSALDTVTAGATNTINAAKTAGGKALKSAVTIAPSAAKVGKHLIKGGGAAAVLLAISQTLGDGVDWVLDPANNSIKYTQPATAGGELGDPLPTGAIKNQKVVKGSDGRWSYDHKYYAGTAAGSCRAYDYSKTTFLYAGVTAIDSNNAQCWIVPKTANGGAGAGTPAQEKYLPIGDVAAKVISNAAAGHAPSQEAVKATALEGFAAGEHDAALDAAAVPDTGVENPPDTENPPKDPEAPAEPFDPSSIIAAINSLKAMLAGILSSMTGFFDWAQAPVPPDDEEKKDVPFATTGDVGLDDVDRFEKRIEFSGQCPSNDFSFSMMGVTYAKPIPYYHLCGFLEQIAPWLLAMCYLGSAYFVVENL